MLPSCRRAISTGVFRDSSSLPTPRIISPLLYGLGWMLLGLSLSCSSVSSPSTAASASGTVSSSTPTPQPLSDPASAISSPELLSESWQVYRQRFIQPDGRVIDWESNSRTVSEGQAYAMLRAVLSDDPDTFERTLQWAENNLKRSALPSDADGRDYLWAWKWGERPDGTWGIQDGNFASDADIDAITALILAARRWQRSDYSDLAQKKLDDLWAQSTITVPALEASQTRRYLLPGPLAAFQLRPGQVYVNPSYLAPYAFRLFAAVETDPDRDWMSLVDSSYDILQQTQKLSVKGLPADWVVLDLAKSTLLAAPAGETLQSRYGFDAYRVWWRVAWDAVWFADVRAQQFLSSHLSYLRDLWQTQGQIPAVMDLSGQPLTPYEATAQYAMLYPAFQQFDPAIAQALYQQKLLPSYQDGIWDGDEAYYVQNLAWFGLFPAADLQDLF
ncbi:glycosyl hydrolase family 8 [Sphaerothrix gracilis]|uniref:glycosyl hydrolase family 8 n=1 Tax=Sphaerothrix gracilis TaxID=3151835 RepID=UPI0031FE3FD3